MGDALIRQKIASGEPPIPPRVPSWGTELTYIQGTGTQWIDTGYTPTLNTIIQTKFRNDVQTGGVILGYCTNDNNDYRIFNASQLIYWDMGSMRINGSQLIEGTIYEFEIGNNYVKNVGASTNILTGTTLTSFNAISTIRLNYAENVSLVSSNTFYYIKFYEGTTLSCNLIPMKADESHTAYKGTTQTTCSAGECGMWDMVEQKFYINSGTGSFIAGTPIRELPSGFVQVEYLESHGTEYINTGVMANTITSLKAIFMQTAWKSYDKILGARNDGVSPNQILSVMNSQSSGWQGLYLGRGSSEYRYSSQIALNTKTTLEIKNGKWYVNDNEAVSLSGSFPNLALYLFTMNYQGSMKEPFAGRMYGVTINNNNDLVPCYITEQKTAYQGSTQTTASAGTAGMYDMVEGKFYINSGTGTFGIGERVTPTRDIPVAYQPVEYISNPGGTQYIKTGVNVSSNLNIKCKIKPISINHIFTLLFNAYTTSGGGNQFTVRGGANNSKLRFRASTSGDVDTDVSVGTIYDIDFNNAERKATLNGTTILSNIGTSNFPNIELPIFAENYNGTFNLGSGEIGLYSFEMLDGTTLLRDFQPVYRVSDGVAGMYDKVNNVFYTNAGSGSFTIGGII